MHKADNFKLKDESYCMTLKLHMPHNIYNQNIFIIIQVATLNSELNQLYEKRMKNGDPLDDKLTVFRQQVCMTQYGMLMRIPQYIISEIPDILSQ